MVLKCCAEFIEQHGIVDGIYRLSGVTSNIQKLRTTFDEDRLPVLYNDENILQDIHSVASLLKMYFRELPNPLCTYQLYKSFVAAVQHSENSERIILMKDTVQKLPPPHYRTLEYLMKHLARVAEHGNRTGMTARNIAIVWAPNLLRCKELEVGGVAALQGVGVQAVVTEFLITNVNLVFSLSDQLVPSQGTVRRLRPKSISLGTPTKLLSLEEAQIKKSIEPGADSSYIEVGGGPACLPEKYHTVIELPMRKRAPLKRSPLGWKSLFTRNMYNTVSGTRKSTSSIETKRKTSVPDEISVEKQDVDALMDSELKNKLRTVKSAESLSNNSNVPSLRNSIIANEYFSPPSPKLPSSGHSRSVSHDSYFDQLAENSPIHVTLQPPDEEGLSDLRVNFDLDESEMKIFSEDDSGQVFSNESSLDQFQLTSKHEAKLASSENTITADPSPKKHKTSDNGSCNSISFSDDVTAISNKRSRLEERLSSGVDFAFIDSHGFGPEQIVVEVDVHRDANNTDTSFLSSSVTDITYSDTLSGYTMSDTVGINGGYTPLSEESCSVQTRSSSRATDDYPKHSSHIMIAGNRYENLPRNRHSYQGSGELLHQHFSNCPRNRLSLQGITKDSSANEYAAIIIDGDRGSGVVGSKSFSDACLTIHVNGGLSSSTENAYEYVCGNSNDDDNVFKDEQSYSAVSSTPTYYNGTTSTIALSCNSQDKFAFGTELENKYEYVSTVPFNYARHSVNIDTATSNTAASATVNTSNGSSSCDGTESHFVYRLSDSVKNGKSAGDVDAIIATNSLESPYELVSVADNKIVITPRYNFSTNLNSTAEEENAGETFSKLIEIPDIDSNYEDLSIGKAEFLSSPDNSESSTDEAMIENHLYESLVTEESSPEASDEQKSFSRPHHVTEYEKKYQDNDDKENCYEKFVINEYYEGENCVLLNDHQPLLLFSEKPSPFSDDVSSSYSPYENQMRALNKECDSKESGNGNSYNHVYVNSEIKGDADGSQFGKRSSMLHVSNRNCERRQSNYSKNEDKEEDANASEKSLSPMHYALQKLEEQNSSPQRNLLSSTSPQSNHSDNADCNKNVQQLMSKFEWSFAGIQCSPEEEKGKVAKGKPNDSPKTPYTKRNSDSRLYRNSDRYSGNEKSLTQTTSLETVKCTSPSSAASTFSRRLSGATSEPSAIRLLVNEDEKNGQTADAVVRRERIEKYKEERRLLLRQKYKTDNIKDVNDEKEEEMIKRFKQKILRAPSTATSDEDVASAAKCSKQKVARPNHLSLNSNVNHTPQYKPSSPSNVTTINILYSPTRSNHQLKSQDKTGNDEDSPASDQCLSLLSDSASSTAVALDKVTCISARYLRSFSQPTAEHGNDRATDNTYRGSSGGSLTIPPAASKKTYGRSAQSSSSLASCYTASLERRKHAKEKSTDGFVAQRISQLSAANLQTCPDEKSFSPQLQQQQQQQQQLVLTATSSNVDVKQNNSSLATTGIRQRAHSTSGPVVQYCIRDIAAIFENKDNK